MTTQRSLQASLPVLALLIDDGIATDPRDNELWPAFIAEFTEVEENWSQNALLIVDTAGEKELRTSDGQNFFRSGFQVVCRAIDYPTGRKKMEDVVASMEGAIRKSVSIEGVDYEISVIIQVSDILYLGRDESKKRHLFSVNGLLVGHES